MVRPYGLLAVLLGSVLLGCNGEGESQPAASPQQITSAPPAELELETLSIESPAADPFAAPSMATEQLVELSEASSESAPRKDLLRSHGGAIAPRNSPELPPAAGAGPSAGGDKFAHLLENDFQAVKDAPLSTFSIDVDTASYSKTRSYLKEHRALPPPDAVRIEELINYFDYDYAGPTDDHPFAVHLETAECPWQPKHRLVRCGLQGKKLGSSRPVSNLVFLIDVSGSMNQPNKLPLVQRSLTLLAQQLGENDRVSIVVYAGAAGLVLPATNGTSQRPIVEAINNLRAGGSTNGGQGIQLAYQLAQENFIQGGANRVVLCSDGDFNVGVTSTGELVRLATEKAKAGIYLSVLGFGIGNHNDAMLEELSNKANGNYAFIDTDAEARKVFVEQLEGTLVTIAKDVKIQVEFNPAEVAAYRLIGYENRKLADRDFNDDKKDAGDIGAGHRVTALYEIIPVGVESDLTKPLVDPLKYQGTGEQNTAKKTDLTDAARNGELLTFKLRYQSPTGGQSTLLTFPVKDNAARFTAATKEFQFAAAVASFGMLLRDSKYKGNTSYAAVMETATAARGDDKQGLRNEFIGLVGIAQSLAAMQGNSSPAPGVPPVNTGAWIQAPPQPILKCGTPDPPTGALGFGSVYYIFFIGLVVGLGSAVIAVLFALGVIGLRTALLANPLPPSKMKPKAAL